MVQALDFSTLTIEPGSLVHAEHAELETDLLYRVQLADRESFVFLLFEHQSSADPMMPYRMARYMLRIWERWTRSQPEPPRSSAALKARASLHRFGRLVLFVLQRARSSTNFVAELAPWRDEMVQLARTDQGGEDLALLIRYIHHTADFEPGSLRELVRGLGRRVEETAMTAAERLRAEGRAEAMAAAERLRAEGRAEGRVEGKAEGRAEGQALLLLRLLTLRFGMLPPEAQARVAQANLEQLAVYAEHVLSADSLDDVLA